MGASARLPVAYSLEADAKGRLRREATMTAAFDAKRSESPRSRASRASVISIRIRPAYHTRDGKSR
jgi:hypothetical protein